MDNLFLILFLISLVALVVGIIKPTVFSSFTKKEVTRKRVSKVFGSTTIVLFLLFGIAADNSENTEIIQEPLINTQTVSGNQATSEIDTILSNSTTTVQTEVNETESQNSATITPNETVGQKNAVKKAKSYIGYSAFSRDGLVAQLEYEQFSRADAIYGADNSGANWNEQAAKKAKSYMEYSAFSRGGLIDQLKYDKFTQEQAEYGANAVGL